MANHIATGTGKKAAQISVVQGRITNGTLFPNISAKILDDVNELIEARFTHLKKKVNDIVKHIAFDLDVALDAEEKRTVMSGTERKQRDGLAEEIRRLQTRHEQVLETVRHLE